jgi:murein DD-endopeptidase MepM/ murein hydrolase activator NlpD
MMKTRLYLAWLVMTCTLGSGCKLAHVRSGSPSDASANIAGSSATNGDQSGIIKKIPLPLPSGTPFKISQVARGKASHNNPGLEYAWDFDVAVGTPVVAVEDGQVIQVWEPKGGGACDPKLSDKAHNIKILAKDGSVAQYVHVQARVQIGDIVRKGQTIATTALNGFICTPQLHFNVFRDRDHTPEKGQPQTIQLLFHGLPDSGLPREGYVGSVP